MNPHVESFAKQLAMQYFLATGYSADFRDAIAWVEANWTEFVDQASQPWALAEYIEEGQRITRELEAFEALCNIFIGPPHPDSAPLADHTAYLEKIEEVFPDWP